MSAEVISDYESKKITALRKQIETMQAQLDNWRQFAASAVVTLDKAALLRIGQMDSQSRADEVQRQIKNVIFEVAEQCRAML